MYIITGLETFYPLTSRAARERMGCGATNTSQQDYKAKLLARSISPRLEAFSTSDTKISILVTERLLPLITCYKCFSGTRSRRIAFGYHTSERRDRILRLGPCHATTSHSIPSVLVFRLSSSISLSLGKGYRLALFE